MFARKSSAARGSYADGRGILEVFDAVRHYSRALEERDRRDRSYGTICVAVLLLVILAVVFSCAMFVR